MYHPLSLSVATWASGLMSFFFGPLLVLSPSHRYPCRRRLPRCFLWPMSNIANQFKLTSATWIWIWIGGSASGRGPVLSALQLTPFKRKKGLSNNKKTHKKIEKKRRNTKSREIQKATTLNCRQICLNAH